MTKIYTLVNQKGGVGKTTSAINLGAYFGQFGQKVLIVDLDPQANASSSLGIDKTTVKNGTYEVIIGNSPVPPAILNNQRFNMSILPSSPALAGAEVELLELNRRAYERLRGERKIAVVPGATHLFEEPGTLEEVGRLAAEWFKMYLR